MKKIIIVAALIITMTVSFTACKKSNPSSQKSTSAESGSTMEKSEEAETLEIIDTTEIELEEGQTGTIN